jgi:hypothetical protein
LFPTALLAPSRLLLKLLLEIELPLLCIVILNASPEVTIRQLLCNSAPLLGELQIRLLELDSFLLSKVDMPRHHLPCSHKLLEGKQSGCLVKGCLLLLLLCPEHLRDYGLLIAAVFLLQCSLFPLFLLLVFEH